MLYPFNGWQGDLFSEAPKLPASKDKNLLNESLKSTANASGNTDIYKQDADKSCGQRTKLQPEDCPFCTARVVDVDHFICLF